MPGEPVRGGPRRAQDVEILISGDVIDAVPLELLGVVVVGRGASGGTAEIERDRSRDRKTEPDGRIDGGVNNGRPAPAIEAGHVEVGVPWKPIVGRVGLQVAKKSPNRLHEETRSGTSTLRLHAVHQVRVVRCDEVIRAVLRHVCREHRVPVEQQRVDGCRQAPSARAARVLTGNRVDERMVVSLVDDDQLVLPARRRNEVPGERGEDDVPAGVLHGVLEHVDASDVGQLPEQTVQLVLKAGGDRIGIDVQMDVGGRHRRAREREAVEDV